jgi:hypothetical protein
MSQRIEARGFDAGFYERAGLHCNEACLDYRQRCRGPKEQYVVRQADVIEALSWLAGYRKSAGKAVDTTRGRYPSKRCVSRTWWTTMAPGISSECHGGRLAPVEVVGQEKGGDNQAWTISLIPQPPPNILALVPLWASHEPWYYIPTNG